MSLQQRPQALRLLKDTRLWTGRGRSRQATISTGHAELDLSLPGGGWPAHALTEVLHDVQGIGEMQLLLPALARLSRNKHIALVAPPYIVNAPALSSVGAELSRITVLPQLSNKDRDWASEQCLRSGAYAAVLMWAEEMPDKDMRRLQLACEHGKAMGFVFRPSRYAAQPSPAALRVQLGPQGQLDVLKARGGQSRRLWWQRATASKRLQNLDVVDLPLPAATAPGCPA